MILKNFFDKMTNLYNVFHRVWYFLSRAVSFAVSVLKLPLKNNNGYLKHFRFFACMKIFCIFTKHWIDSLLGYFLNYELGCFNFWRGGSWFVLIRCCKWAVPKPYINTFHTTIFYLQFLCLSSTNDVYYHLIIGNKQKSKSIVIDSHAKMEKVCKISA